METKTTDKISSANVKINGVKVESLDIDLIKETHPVDLNEVEKTVNKPGEKGPSENTGE